MPVQINLVIARVLQFGYSQLIGDVEILVVVGDNDTPQQQETQQQIKKAVYIQYDLDMTQVDMATTEPNPNEPEPQNPSGTINRT